MGDTSQATVNALVAACRAAVGRCPGMWDWEPEMHGGYKGYGKWVQRHGACCADLRAALAAADPGAADAPKEG